MAHVSIKHYYYYIYYIPDFVRVNRVKWVKTIIQVYIGSETPKVNKYLIQQFIFLRRKTTSVNVSPASTSVSVK